MAAPSGKQYGSGLRHVRAHLLSSSTGLPAAVNTTAYIGLHTAGAMAFELTIPDVRRIAHTGDDHLMATTKLPRIEVSSALIRLSRNDYDLHALLSGTKEATIGESKVIGHATDLQGYEPDVCLTLTQQSKDAVSGLKRWRTYFIPVTQVDLKPAGLSAAANEYVGQIILSPVSKYPWGIAFALGVEGFRTAEVLEANTDNPVILSSWVSGAATTDFLFDTNYQLVDVDKVLATTVDGVIAAPTVALDKLTFAVTPGLGKVVTCAYEVAAL